MEERSNEIWCIVGGRSTGKTTFVKGDKKRNIPSVIFNAYFNKSKPHPTIKKGLIIDTFDSKIWRDYPVLPRKPEFFKHWETGVYRIFGGDIDHINNLVQKYIYNTLIIYEDATKTIGTRLTRDVRMFLLDCKQKNLDIILIFHSISAIPLELGRLPFDKLVLFKTGQRWEKVEGRIDDPEEKVKAAFKRVQNSKNQYEYEIVDIRTN